MAEFKYDITKYLGVIGQARGMNLELNMVSWNDREPKYDVRTWNDDHSRMGKGVSLTEEELEKLIELFNARNEEDELGD